MSVRRTLQAAAVVGLGTFAAPAISAQQVDNMYTNLRVLPENITREQLNEIMLSNLRGLGLPRRQNQGCLYCHAGDMDVPVSEWDFASDEKETKQKARVMMQMVADINGRHLPELESRIAPDLEVTCYTCHAGRTDPRPIQDLLINAYGAGGIDSLIHQYSSLRARYFGADAYDFRSGVLLQISTGIADAGSFDDALRLAALNAELNPDDADTRRNWLRIQLERTHSTRGIASALQEFDTFRATEPTGIATWAILDWMGWRLWRKDLREDAGSVFARSLELFGDEYIPNESMASVVRANGDLEGAIAIYEAWLSEHPDHAMARRQHTNLVNRRNRR